MNSYKPLKSCFLKPGQTSLEVICLREGTLDVCLETAAVFGKKGKVKTRLDDDGYVVFDLARERKDRRGKKDGDGRHRMRRKVRVNRLVKIKAIAHALGGEKWRLFCQDLPRGIDVNHIDKNRANNKATNLELQTEAINRRRAELDQEAADGIVGDIWD